MGVPADHGNDTLNSTALRPTDLPRLVTGSDVFAAGFGVARFGVLTRLPIGLRERLIKSGFGLG